MDELGAGGRAGWVDKLVICGQAKGRRVKGCRDTDQTVVVKVLSIISVLLISSEPFWVFRTKYSVEG